MHKKKVIVAKRSSSSAALVQGDKTAALLQRALALHKNGQLADAEILYLEILKIDPRYFDALQFLGMIQRAKGELQLALDSLACAAQINPSNLTVHASLGNVLLDLGRYVDAIASYDRFLAMTPDFAEVLNNKANALSALGREAEAMSYYEQALQKQPDFSDVYFNRGNLHMDMRQFELALNDYEHVLRSNLGHYQAWNNRGNALFKLGRLPEALHSYQQGLTIAPDNAELLGCAANVYKMSGHLNEAVQLYGKVLALNASGFPRQNAALQLAILHYVHGDATQVAPLLEIAKEMLNQPHGKDPGSLIYCVFMLKIQLWWQSFLQQAGLPRPSGFLYVIGESHMLSVHNLVVPYRGQNLQCKGFWVEGCTQWRVGHAELNHYQQLFTSYLQSMPEASMVLLTIGEIDCRIDGGILKAHKKSPDMGLPQRIHSTISAYLAHITKVARVRKLSVVVAGVPAYYIDTSAYNEQTLRDFGEFLAMFNTALKQQSLDIGMAFLDVFALTDSGTGKASEQWHIDQHHLRPDAMLAAFERCLTLP